LLGFENKKNEKRVFTFWKWHIMIKNVENVIKASERFSRLYTVIEVSSRYAL